MAAAAVAISSFYTVARTSRNLPLAHPKHIPGGGSSSHSHSRSHSRSRSCSRRDSTCREQDTLPRLPPLRCSFFLSFFLTLIPSAAWTRDGGLQSPITQTGTAIRSITVSATTLYQRLTPRKKHKQRRGKPRAHACKHTRTHAVDSHTPLTPGTPETQDTMQLIRHTTNNTTQHTPGTHIKYTLPRNIRAVETHPAPNSPYDFLL